MTRALVRGVLLVVAWDSERLAGLDPMVCAIMPVGTGSAPPLVTT